VRRAPDRDVEAEQAVLQLVERRGQEAGSRHDEGPTIHHWMISERGMVSPSALAVYASSPLQ
jgi:hypothetical protein